MCVRVYHSPQEVVNSSDHQNESQPVPAVLPLCECAPNDGSVELFQLKHLWNMHIGSSKDGAIPMNTLARLVVKSNFYGSASGSQSDVRFYDYSFTKVQYMKNEFGLIVASFSIFERYEGDYTHGGATFKINILGTYTVASCSYKDQFDGGYKVCCILREKQSTIEVYLMNSNFLSYQLYDSHHKLLTSLNVTNTNPIIDHSGKMVSTDSAHETKSCILDEDFWLVSKEHGWRYVRNGQTTKLMSKHGMDLCLAQNYSSSMVVSGDSHLRAVFYYIHSGVRGYNTDIKLSAKSTDPDFIMHATNDTFQSSTFASMVAQHLRDIYENTKLKMMKLKPNEIFPKKLMLLNSGSWDLAFKSSAQFLVDFEEVMDVIILLKKQNAYEIIWQSIPTWPHSMEHTLGRHVNSYIIGAVNAWVEWQLKEIGIPVINMWRMAMPFEDTNVACGCHYLCQGKNDFYGHVGIYSAQEIMKAACDMNL